MRIGSPKTLNNSLWGHIQLPVTTYIRHGTIIIQQYDRLFCLMHYAIRDVPGDILKISKDLEELDSTGQSRSLQMSSGDPHLIA